MKDMVSVGKQDLVDLLAYLQEEQRDYEAQDRPSGHVYETIARLEQDINDNTKGK